MPETTIPQDIKSKKAARQLIYNKLSDALVEFKSLLKKKKFDSKMLKATNLFAVDIAKAARKNGKKAKPVLKVKSKKAEVKKPEAAAS